MRSIHVRENGTFNVIEISSSPNHFTIHSKTLLIMTSVQIFNVCTHGKESSGGLGGAIPTPCVISTHPTNAQRFASGGGDANVFVK